MSSSGKVEATSEIHFVSEGVFLCLARDGNGHGGSGDNIKYKWVFSASRFSFRGIYCMGENRHADLFSIANATDIHGTAFDSPATPVAPKGVLSKKVTPATYVSFVDYADATQLARFGLHNGMKILTTAFGIYLD